MCRFPFRRRHGCKRAASRATSHPGAQSRIDDGARVLDLPLAVDRALQVDVHGRSRCEGPRGGPKWPAGMSLLLVTFAAEGAPAESQEMPLRDILVYIFVGVVIVALWLAFRRMRPEE